MDFKGRVDLGGMKDGRGSDGFLDRVLRKDFEGRTEGVQKKGFGRKEGRKEGWWG
jgi:hypothetical protein